MSYAIIRNEKLTRAKSYGAYVHNDRKAKNHSNKDIDPTRTHLNFYCKENELTYIREFDRMQKELDLKGNLRKNSIIMCQMMITSDNEFFKKIGLEETKRYFIESYKFVCNYKNLGEKNIVSAAVHLDETTPHMHLVFIPVIHTKDEQGNAIDKICAKDFWKGRDSYRKLQNDYHKYVTSKGFDLERGLPVEETGAKNLKIEELKKITNFANTKKLLNNIKLELPEVPDINDIKLIQLNKAKVEKDIIKPQNNLIKELFHENISLHAELSKQAKLIDEAEKYQKERNIILADNEALNERVKLLEHEYKKKSNTLDLRYENRKRDLEKEFENKTFELRNRLYNRIDELERENTYLNKIVNKFKETIEKFIHWICKRFSITEEEDLIRDFQMENDIYLDPEKQIQYEEELEYENEF